MSLYFLQIQGANGARRNESSQSGSISARIDLFPSLKGKILGPSPEKLQKRNGAGTRTKNQNGSV